MAENTNPDWLKEVKAGNDPFNGDVSIFEDLTVPESEDRFWVEHQRKSIISDYVTREEANKLFDQYVDDTQF